MAEESTFESSELSEPINYFLFISAMIGEQEAPRQLHFFRTRDQALLALQRFYDSLKGTADQPSSIPGLSLIRERLDQYGCWAEGTRSAVNPDRPPLVIRLQEVGKAHVEFSARNARFELETQIGWDPR